MTERDRLKALLLCSAIVETAEKVRRDLERMQRAAQEFAASIEKLRETSS